MKNRAINRILTRDNIFQHLEVLKRNRAKRTKHGQIVIEGVIPINLCVASQVEIRQIFFADYEALSQWAKGIIEKSPLAELYSLNADLMLEVSDRDEGSELIVLASKPLANIGQIDCDRILILDRPSNPGNFGAIVRSCTSFGIDAIFTFGHSVDAYDPKSIAASRGTVFSIPILDLNSRQELEQLLGNEKRKSDFAVFGSSAKNGIDLRLTEKVARFALIIGNETTGMTRYLQSLVDAMLRIPMSGDATSLNVGCAASILLYQLTG